MPTYALTDGTNVVSLNPDYDMKTDSKKIESSMRTRAGANYRYIWGRFKSIKMKVDYLSSADQCQVNSWWSANTPLRLLDLTSTVVISAYITNTSQPIDQYVAPYTDQYKGTIDLESY
jgi:hypothetical protein